MTHEEWETWKRLSPKKFKQMHDLPNLREAKAKRQQYLMEEVSYETHYKAVRDFDSMTNMYIVWMNTPQGHQHWSELNERKNPIR